MATKTVLIRNMEDFSGIIEDDGEEAQDAMDRETDSRIAREIEEGRARVRRIQHD